MGSSPPSQIVWSARAVDDLREIAAYIRQHRPRSARRVLQEIRSAMRRLAQFPLSGRVLPEYLTDVYREVIVRDYRVVYRTAPGQIRVVAVVHGSRDLPSLAPFNDFQ